MKGNNRKHNRFLGLWVAGILALAAAGVGFTYAAGRLRDIYLEQCVIRDVPAQVSVSAGKMVKADVIAENLGLVAGANLATLDLKRKREDLLAKVPNLQSIRISRRLPDRISVVAEERVPVARMGIRGSRKESGRVVDTEGMVFVWQRGTQSLPVIREAQAPGTPRGYRIKGRTLAALRLIEACADPELQELGVLEVDTSKRDFLVATLGNYSKVKILWEEMDKSTPHAHDDLVERLTNLRNTIRTQLAPTAVIWNATIKRRVFADTQEKF